MPLRSGSKISDRRALAEGYHRIHRQPRTTSTTCAEHDSGATEGKIMTAITPYSKRATLAILASLLAAGSAMTGASAEAAPSAKSTPTASTQPPIGKPVSLMASHSGKVVDLAPNPSGDTRRVIQYTSNGGNNQAWLMESAGSGVQFKSKDNGKCITISAKAGSGDPVDELTDGRCGSDHSQFKLEPTGGDTYMIESLKWPGIVLDVSGSSMADGAKIEPYAKKGGANQKFKIQSSEGRPKMWDYSPGARLGIEGAPIAGATFESIIYNESAETYTRTGFNEKEHVNLDAPDEIEPGQVGILQIRSDNLWTGPEGSVSYRSRSGNEVKVNWDLPHVGANKYTVKTTGINVSARDQNDNRFSVSPGQSHYAEGSSFGPDTRVFTAFTIGGLALEGGPKPSRGGKCEAYASAVNPGFDWSIIAANLSDKQRAWLEALTNTTDKIDWAPNAPWWATGDGQAGAMIGAAIGGIIAGCDPWTSSGR